MRSQQGQSEATGQSRAGSWEAATSSPTVGLVFPPLVQTSFGSYFPSTAALAAYLTSRGISSRQDDLNEQFAIFLLQDEVIESFIEGRVGRDLTPAPESMAVVAARLLQHRKHLLFDEQGRHRFRDDMPGPGHLLALLARPCLIDQPLPVALEQDRHQWPNYDIYERFLAEVDYPGMLEPSLALVGISVPMGPQLMPALLLATQIKQARPETVVVLGGPVISLMSAGMRQLLLQRCPEVDLLVRFEGEVPLATLAQQLLTGSWSPQTVPGTSLLRNHELVECPAEPGPALDDLPFAEYDAVILDQLAEPELGILQARGCYWGRCAYCDYVELYAEGTRYRTRTPKRFVDGLEQQVERYQARRFSFISESIPPGFARRVSSEIIRRGLKIAWNSFAMIDRKFDRDLLDLMRRSGCEYLVLGLETMNDRLLALVDKRARQEDNIRFLQDGRDAGIKLMVNLIPDLPSTSYQEAMDSLRQMQELADCCASTFAFPFEATRSSAVGRDPHRYHLQPADPEQLDGQGEFATNHLPVIDQAMTPAQRQEVYAAYSRFGQSFNQWWGQEQSIFATGDQLDDDQSTVRLADEYLDILDTGDGLRCYHWGLREAFQMPSGWSRIISMTRDMGWFEPSEFINRFQPPAVGRQLLEQMTEHAILLRQDKER